MTTVLPRTPVLTSAEIPSRPGSHPNPFEPGLPIRRQGAVDTRHTRSPLGLSCPGHSASSREWALYRAATDPDVFAWLDHVRPAAACSSPVRLSGTMTTLDASTGVVLSTVDTADLPDGVLYKPCGNRRATVCPACAQTYQRDAYQLIRAGLVGGKGVPATVAEHLAVFATFTAPSFGPVHTRVIDRHTCTRRSRCDCRPDPCHARRNASACQHGRPMACYARHELTDRQLGQPLCLDCYDYPAHVVWNNQASELWRRTSIALRKALPRLARQRGIDPATVRFQFGKVAEMQRRGVVHFHAIVRLDGADPTDPDVMLPPPAGFDHHDLVGMLIAAARVRFTTDPHPANPDGWPIRWGTQVDVRPITLGPDGEVTEGKVAGYLAKYATKSTETTGHLSRRLTGDTIDLHANPDGTHPERILDACWTTGTPKDWRGLRRWAHMLGFGGHFLTKSRRYSVTFRVLRDQRILFRRQVDPPAPAAAEAPTTTLVVNFLQFVGSGWHTTGDALLANTAAAMAREHQAAAREALADLQADTVL